MSASINRRGLLKASVAAAAAAAAGRGHAWDGGAVRHIVPAANVPKSYNNYHTQGFWPLKDGSVLVNIGDTLEGFIADFRGF